METAAYLRIRIETKVIVEVIDQDPKVSDSFTYEAKQTLATNHPIPKDGSLIDSALESLIKKNFDQFTLPEIKSLGLLQIQKSRQGKPNGK
jgi:hypothetical protein